MQKQIFIKKLILVVATIVVALTIYSPQLLLARDTEYFQNLEGVCGSRTFPCPGGKTAAETAQNLTGAVGKYVKVIMGAVAIAIIVIAGIKLVINDGNEETLDKEILTIVYAIIGLFMIGLASEISQIFRVDNGGFMKDPNTALQTSRYFSRSVEVIITFIKYIIGSLASYAIVSSGLKMILVGSKDEELEKNKKNIGWGLGGLVIVLMANPIINKVLFKVDTDKFPGIETVRPAIDRVALIKEIAGVTNIMASFAGPIALLALVAGGVLYTFAGGDDEKTGKAKKIITWAIIGIVIIYGAFAIVSLFVTREFKGI